ncbi:unnamed protein product, partial [Scytosiphon promiscuus]
GAGGRGVGPHRGRRPRRESRAASAPAGHRAAVAGGPQEALLPGQQHLRQRRVRGTGFARGGAGGRGPLPAAAAATAAAGAGEGAGVGRGRQQHGREQPQRRALQPGHDRCGEQPARQRLRHRPRGQPLQRHRRLPPEHRVCAGRERPGSARDRGAGRGRLERGAGERRQQGRQRGPGRGGQGPEPPPPAHRQQQRRRQQRRHLQLRHAGERQHHPCERRLFLDGEREGYRRVGRVHLAQVVRNAAAAGKLQRQQHDAVDDPGHCFHALRGRGETAASVGGDTGKGRTHPGPAARRSIRAESSAAAPAHDVPAAVVEGGQELSRAGAAAAVAVATSRGRRRAEGSGGGGGKGEGGRGERR